MGKGKAPSSSYYEDGSRPPNCLEIEVIRRMERRLNRQYTKKTQIRNSIIKHSKYKEVDK